MGCSMQRIIPHMPQYLNLLITAFQINRDWSSRHRGIKGQDETSSRHECIREPDDTSVISARRPFRGQDETSSRHGSIKGQYDTSFILARRLSKGKIIHRLSWLRWYISCLGTEVSKGKVTLVILARSYPGARWDIGHIGTGALGRQASSHFDTVVLGVIGSKQNRRTIGKVAAINASNSPPLHSSIISFPHPPSQSSDFTYLDRAT